MPGTDACWLAPRREGVLGDVGADPARAAPRHNRLTRIPDVMVNVGMLHVELLGAFCAADMHTSIHIYKYICIHIYAYMTHTHRCMHTCGHSAQLRSGTASGRELSVAASVTRCYSECNSKQITGRSPASCF
eukprot:2549630-Rhodomonas_salina.2